MKIKITRSEYGYQTHIYASGRDEDRGYAHVLDHSGRATQAIENYSDTCMGVMVYTDDEPQVTWVDK